MKMTRATLLALVLCSFAAQAHAQAWNAYNLSPTSRTLYPVAVYTTSGTTENAGNILTGNSALIEGTDSYITLDFGKEVGGIVTVQFTAASDTSEQLGLAFSESTPYVGINSDASNSGINSGAGGPTDGAIYANVTSTGNSTYTMPIDKVRGGFRYLTLFMNTNGWVHVSTVSCVFSSAPNYSTPNSYPDYWYSNDNNLNAIWYAGAYTTQMDTIVPTQGRVYPLSTGWENDATVSGGTSALVDGAKRDRAVWPGDIGISGATDYVSIDDMLSIKNSLSEMYSIQQSNGQLPYGGPPFNFYGSDTYHMWSMIGTYNYFLYSGDTTWLNSVWSGYQLAMSYILAKVNGPHGLLDVTGTNDWARSDQGGENIEANAILYRVLVTGAMLSTAEGNSSLASSWNSQAATLKTNINSALWNAGEGAYSDNPGSILFPEDGNSLAVWFGVTNSAAQSTLVVQYLKSLWSTFGSRTPEWGSGVHPFAGSMELMAFSTAADDEDMLNMIRNQWGYMFNNPISGKTFWEGVSSNGTPGYGWYTSFCHGWSTGPTSALTFYTLGIMPTSINGLTYSVIPHPADLTSCQGQLTVASGKLVNVSWTRSNNSTFSLTLTSGANTGSTGTVGIPLFGASRTITVNGGTAWNGSSYSSVSGISGATTDGNYVYFNGVQPGTYTFAYSGSAVTWLTCGGENAACTFQGTKGVRYGAGNQWVYGTFTNKVNCANTTFGDPDPGVVKSCQTSDTVIPPTPGIWISCAAENGACNFENTQTVAFGAAGLYNTGSFTSSVSCSDSVFQDPDYGVVKSCYNAVLPANPGFEAPSTSDYTYAPSNGIWTFSGSAGSGSGVQQTGQGGSFGAAYAPQGAQTAFLQDAGTITQTIDNMPADQYEVTFLAAKRAGYAGTETFNVSIDGTVIGSFEPASTAFSPFTTNPIVLGTGSHTLVFTGTNTSGDNTDFIDSVAFIHNNDLNGVHTMTPQCATGSRMDDASAGTTNGNAIQIWTAAGDTNQEWNFASVTSSNYNIAVNLGPYCIDAGKAQNGTPLQIWGCNGSADQSWQPTSVNGGYTFTSAQSGLCITVTGSGNANGTLVESSTCSTSTGQIWAVD